MPTPWMPIFSPTAGPRAGLSSGRCKEQLPFPEFDKDLGWEEESRLDYPSMASPDYKPRECVSQTQPKG